MRCDDLGIYVHIPYCKSICPYCDFNSYVQPKPPWEAFTDALVAELGARAAAFEGTVGSVYFGGGTPSLAPPSLFERVLEAVAGRFGVRSEAEVTMEANPGTLNGDKLSAWRKCGINRISLGWQSTHDRLLRVLGRGHSAQESMTAFRTARSLGWDNISVDLIFAVPGQTMAELDADLDTLISINPEHVSLYALTYHEGTPFYDWRASGRVTPAAEELELAMMERIEERLLAAGFVHYEVSNYARPGFRAVHNSAYWTGVPYLGIGPGAHSFARIEWQRGWRWEAVRDPARYTALWSGGAAAAPSLGLPQEEEPSVEWVESLSPRQMLSERMMCGVRMLEGAPLDCLDDESFAPYRGEVDEGIAVAVERGWGRVAQRRLVPTRAGLRHVDDLGALFF